MVSLVRRGNDGSLHIAELSDDGKDVQKNFVQTVLQLLTACKARKCVNIHSTASRWLQCSMSCVLCNSKHQLDSNICAIYSSHHCHPFL